ncbi:pullulanase-type alpha-1,6-glucosidase, partial [Kineococcus glutinatus]|uniref:pullulanase-type alpha-1,6-glucosidase n=1 Tax=Kineococcus glutinatus TaxID=1070872 RepID=UPI0031E8456D
ATDASGTVTAATAVQVPGVLDSLHPGAARRTLGPTWHRGRPSLALWAPTARSVTVHVSDPRTGARTASAPLRADRDGVWSVTGERRWKDAAYLFEVEVFVPETGRVERNLVTDPYSVGLTANSGQSLLLDLDDAALTPKGWDRLRKPALAQPEDLSIYELHVRDFSITDTTVPAAHRGTYAAFTDTRSDGMRHLRELADSGLRAVHLLPVNDISTVEERRSAQQQPRCDLPALPPDSAQQQECVGAVAAQDGFNWGYDPLHWTTPEGSYATSPDGGVRTREFRDMVAALNRTGLRVVQDVVYNHTPDSGQGGRSDLDRIVPGYYHRLDPTSGAVETSTCCANTAPEHTMMGKLVVDSVVTIAREYKVDGFRFDLMGHHPKQNVLDVRAALDRLTPQRDGVDGRGITLYGEGWNFGEVADDARFVQATQLNMAGTGIGTFTDRLRDAVRGGGPFDENPRVQGFGSGLSTDPNGDPVNGTPEQQRERLLLAQDQIRVGLTGNLADFAFTDRTGARVTGSQVDYNGQPAGYTADPQEAVTYVEAHDNETLYDALAYKLPQDTPVADRTRMQTLALATTAFGQGISFWHAGGDALRSKSLDRNSYDSGDWFNVLDHSGTTNGFGRGLPPAADNEAKYPFMRPLLADPALRPSPADIRTARERAEELLEIRESTPLFHLGSADLVQRKLSFPGSGPQQTPGVIVMRIDDTAGRDVDPRLQGLVVVFNASPRATTQVVPGTAGQRFRLHPVQARGGDPVVRGSRFDAASGAFTVPARTAAVFRLR